MSLLDRIKADREAGTPQFWTAEKSNCRDLSEDGWALVWDNLPGGRKNPDGTTTHSLRFPMLLASDWLDNPQHGMAVIADALNLAERADRLIPAAEAMASAAEALGAMPEGYCFCSQHRVGDDSKTHEPECAHMRAALAAWKEATA